MPEIPEMDRPGPGLEPPVDLTLSPRVLVGQLAEAIGNVGAARVCIALLSGADPRDFRVELDYLGGRPGRAVFEGTWPDPWAGPVGSHVGRARPALRLGPGGRGRDHRRSGRRGVAPG